VSAPFLAKNNATRADVVAAVNFVALPRKKRTAIVLTALDIEYVPMRDELRDLHSESTSHGTRFEVGSLHGVEIDWDVAIAQIGPGNLGAAVETTQSILEYDADIILFVGIAGARKVDLDIGTVVVARHVAFYGGGQATVDGLHALWKARPTTFNTSHRVLQHAIVLARDWPTGPVVVKPIAAGDALIKSGRSEVGRILELHYNDVVAVDMESAGMYDAAYRANKPALAVRGISDHLDDKDAATDKRDQPLASQRAAMFAADFLRTADSTVFPSN
jgi:nucleoside phosphorylase